MTSGKQKMKRNDTGAALLVVLLLVATLSVVSVGILQTVTRSVQVASMTGARNQIVWYVSGAETLAAQKISQLSELTQGSITRFSPGLGQTIAFPIEGGRLMARVDDATNCFNLNSLGHEAEDSETTAAIDAGAFYVELLKALDLPQSDAQQLMQVAKDWIDADSVQQAFGAENGFYASLSQPRSAANGPIVTPAELLDMRGYTPELYRMIAPYVCARPDEAIGVFNINTMDERHAPIMSAVFSGQVGRESMRAIMEAQGDLEFPDVETFLTEPTLAAVAPELRHETLLGTTSKFFRLSGEVVYAEAMTSYEAVFRLGSDNSVQLVRRRIGVDE